MCSHGFSYRHYREHRVYLMLQFKLVLTMVGMAQHRGNVRAHRTAVPTLNLDDLKMRFQAQRRTALEPKKLVSVDLT